MSFKKLVSVIFNNYFWLITISALIGIIGGKQYLISILYPFVLFIYAFISSKEDKTNIINRDKSCVVIPWKLIIDVIFCLLFVSIIMSWFLNSYPNRFSLCYRHILGPIAYMMAYFIGKNLSSDKVYLILEKSFLPVAITSVLGIYYFFFPPSWYLSILDDGHLGSDSLEALRLHSIFSSPYVLAYMTSFLLSYIIFKVYQYGESFKKYQYYVIIFIVTILLCMMRAPMAFVIISFFIGLMYSVVFKKKWNLLINSLIVVSILFLAFFLATRKMDTDILDFLVEKIVQVTDDSDDFLEQRYNLFESKDSFFGDGAGRHNIWAEDYGQLSIRDGEYQKLNQEVGIVGKTLFIMFFSLAILRCVLNIKYLPFELSVLIFLMLSMIGACPLSTIDKHSFLFWLVAGRVAAFDKNEYMSFLKKNTISNRLLKCRKKTKITHESISINYNSYI